MRPNVAIDPGLRLDDATAGRLVDKMLAALNYDLDQAYDFFKQAIGTMTASLGNPKGQRRFTDRYFKLFHRALIAKEVSYGKRLRFAFNYDTFEVYQTKQGRYLALVQNWVVGEGPSKKIDYGAAPILYFSRHALVRLVQRGDCRTPEDLLAVLRNTASLARAAVIASEGGLHLPFGSKSGWLIPTMAGDGLPPVYLVLRKYERERADSLSMPAVVTALSWDMVPNAGAMSPLYAMLAFDAPGPLPDDHWRNWRTAFEMTTLGTRKQ